MNTFKKILITAGLTLFGLVVSTLAQTAPAESNQTTKMTINCRDNNLDCLARAAEKCERATLTNNVSVTFFDQKFSQAAFYEIKGGDADRCEFYLKILDWRVDTVEMSETQKEEIKRKILAAGGTFAEMTEEEKKQSAEREEGMKKRMNDVIGTDGICKFQADNLATLLRRWQNRSFSSADYQGANCRGTYFTPANGFYDNEK